MLRLALAQMRRSPGRLAAAGVAIALGSAFVAVALLAGDVMTRTAYRAVTAQYANADIVLEGPALTDADAAALAEVPGVAAAEPRTSTWVEVAGDAGALWIQLDAPAEDPRLEARSLVSGRAPSEGEIALPEGSAASLGLEVGDTATVTVTRAVAEDIPAKSDEPGYEESVQVQVDHSVTDLTVVGLVDDGTSSLVGSLVGLATRDQVLEWVVYQAPDMEPAYATLLVTVDDGANAAALKGDVRRALGTSNAFAADTTVRTLDEQAEWIISDLTSEARLVTTIGLGFAAIALLVAALVIANTFQVLVAQRTRTLALLRCVGADRSQLRRSVIIEALMLGVLGAGAGILLGTGLVQGALLVLSRTWPGVPLPDGATVTPWSVAVPLLVGCAVTLVAALAPARAATRVSPLAAMRPTDAPRVGERGGRARAWVAGVLVVAGGLAMAGGVALGARSDIAGGLGLGVLGGAVSFLGVLLSAVFWAPRLVALASRLVGRSPAARLAGANSARNPRRTAATSSALLIGVTLVVMMATGAASARGALAGRLDNEFPFDLQARAIDEVGNPDQLPATLIEVFEQTAGVGELAVLPTATVDVAVAGGTEWQYNQALGMSPADAERVLRSSDQVAGLSPGTVVVPEQVAGWSGIADGDVLTVSVSDVYDPSADTMASGAGTPVELTAVVTELPGTTFLLTPDTLASVSADAPAATMWVRLDDGADPGETVTLLETAASQSTGSSVLVTAAATERAAYQEVIDTMLAIVIGLLAVSVVIALVGVANTLSLSVIERRRESATLRAIGLSRGQLRASLAAEGMVIAGVGAVTGAVMGTIYGWVGARTVLVDVGPTPFVVAWREVALVTAVAVVAGLAASVLPARSAVRTSPVEALAVE